MFKVLVIAYYFPPMGLSGVQRTLKFTKYMSKFNWKPTVVTAGATAYYAHDESLLMEAEESDIEIIRTSALDPGSFLAALGTLKMPREFIRKFLSKISKTLFIPDNKISWAKAAYIKSRELLQQNQFDAIFVTIPPFSSFVYAAKLKEEFKIPLFVDYRDLWVGNQFSFIPTPYHLYKHKKLEYNALRKADKVFVTNRKIKEVILKQYQFLSFKDVDIVPHGYDPEDFEKNPPFKREDDKIRITYAGIFYENITPKYLLHSLRELLNERPEIASKFEFHFIGHFRTENKKIVKKLNLEHYVIEHEYLSHNHVIKHIMASDILWVMLGVGKGMDTISLGKLYEYFNTRKPILACLPEGASKFAVEEYGAAFICPPDDKTEIKKQLILIYEAYQNKVLPKPNLDFVERHNRIFLTEQITTEFQFFLKEQR
ncbi:MAG: glycosyltransferase [bacterium]